MSPVSSLVINEPPLQVLPSLAKAIGLQEAIVLQQFHYWLGQSKNVNDGRKWIYNTFEQWALQFPFWSAEALRKIVRSLRNQGLIEVRKLSANAWDKTNFYAINYEALDAVGSRLVEAESSTDSSGKSAVRGGKDGLVDAVNLAASTRDGIPHLYTETTQRLHKRGGEVARVPAHPAPAAPPGVAFSAPTKTSKSPKKSGLPPDLVPGDAAAHLAAQHGLDLAREVAAFCDHHGAAGTLMADWQRGLCVWLRRSVRFAERDAREAVRRGGAGLPAETLYQRSMRERMEEVAPQVARKAPGARAGVDFFEALVAAPVAPSASDLRIGG